jgi:sulfur carrier protein
MTLRLRINGQAQQVAAATLEALLREQALDPAARGLAVARNGRVIKRSEWANTELVEGDRIEIVRPFAGG